MEQHRARIEADHNRGIPRREWERMEQIIDGALKTTDVATVAAAYRISEPDLLQWLNRRRQPPRLRMRICVEVPRSTVVKRIQRGWDAITAETKPIITPSERARRAAFSRWDKLR